MPLITEKRIHAVFEVGLVLKGLNALAELGAGFTIAFVSPAAVGRMVAALVHSELLEDPKDFIAGALLHFAATYSISAQHFAVYYLISHGAAKLFVVGALMAGKRWAYPLGLVVLGLFIAYQLYRMVVAPSLGLTVITVFDVIILWLIWHEYQLVRRHLPLT